MADDAKDVDETFETEFKGSTQHQEFEFEIKAVGEDGSFSGYAAVYGNIDLGRDVIEPFAAKRSLKKSAGKMPVLRNHSAKVEDIVGENQTAVEDSKGFLVSGKFDLSRDSGADTYKAVKFAKEHGRKMGLSIGFIPNWKQVDYIENVRHLKEIHIVEYSVVVFPMNPKAQISSIKSFSKDASEEEIVQKKREIEASLRDVGCNQEEQKAAVAAVFALREVDEDEVKNAKEVALQKEQEEADKKEFVEICESVLTRIKENNNG